MADVPKEEASTTETSNKETVKVWKFECSLVFIKSINGIFNIVLVILSLLCLIILSAAKDVGCVTAYVSTYGFYNFAYGSCVVTYVLRFIIYVLSLNTKLLWIFPWLIWNPAVSLFFAICFFFSSVAVLANVCGRLGGYAAAGAFGFITFAVMTAELVYNIIVLRRDHPPTENKILLKIGVERKPPGTTPEYQADGDAQQEESKY